MQNYHTVFSMTNGPNFGTKKLEELAPFIAFNKFPDGFSSAALLTHSLKFLAISFNGHMAKL